MRRSLAGISTAVTCLVALAFLVPLSLLVGDVVRDRALADAFRTAAAVGPVLALTTEPREVTSAIDGIPGAAGRTSVHLSPSRPGGEITVIGSPAVAPGTARGAMQAGLATTAPVSRGRAVLQPVALTGGRVAVVEVDVPDAVLSRGVPHARTLLALLALVLVAGSVALADRLAARVVRAATQLRTASARLGAGDLDVRLSPDGPPELREAASAFNAMADRVGELLAAERERAADLSHRLRTPLAGLVLTGRSLGPGLVGDQVRALTARLEQEVDAIIREARGSEGSAQGGADADARGAARGGADGARDNVPRRLDGGADGSPGVVRAPARGRCDAAAVLRERLDFWGALAEDQNRRWELRVTGAGPHQAPVAAGDLATAVDALLGNVFLHTPEGCAFAVRVDSSPSALEIAVSDEGDGIADPDEAVRRGASSAGSSGLGLDIVSGVARCCGGRLTIGRSETGGARVALLLPAVDVPAGPVVRRRRGSARRRSRDR
jgi:signal transduction histidine kinase